MFKCLISKSIFYFCTWIFLQTRLNIHCKRTFVIRKSWINTLRLYCVVLPIQRPSFPPTTYTHMHIFRNFCVKRGNAFLRSQMVTSNTFYAHAAIKQLIQWRYKQIEHGYYCITMKRDWDTCNMANAICLFVENQKYD